LAPAREITAALPLLRRTVENFQPFAAIIVIALLSLGGYYGWKQVRALRHLRGQRDLPPPDRRYHYTQASLRLVSCALLVILASLIGGSYLLGMEKAADQIVQPADGEKPELNAEQKKEFLNKYTTLWSAALVVLMLLLLLAAYDLWAIRRYGLRHHRQIQADRQAMIEQEISIIRTQRNGHT